MTLNTIFSEAHAFKFYNMDPFQTILLVGRVMVVEIVRHKFVVQIETIDPLHIFNGETFSINPSNTFVKE